MFPKAYIFSTQPMPDIYKNLKTKYSANIKITSQSPYLFHHPDVSDMATIANYKHPNPAYTHALTVPNVNKSLLLAELLKKNDESFFIVESESDLPELKTLAEKIEQIGPDYRLIENPLNNIFHQLFREDGGDEKTHDECHELIRSKFVSPIKFI